MVRMLVMCSGDDKNRFDREYYANTHLTLTLNCWGPHGLLAVSAFFPPVAHGKGCKSAVGLDADQCRNGLNAHISPGSGICAD